jgi:hypothetical protein
LLGREPNERPVHGLVNAVPLLGRQYVRRWVGFRIARRSFLRVGASFKKQREYTRNHEDGCSVSFHGRASSLKDRQ